MIVVSGGGRSGQQASYDRRMLWGVYWIFSRALAGAARDNSGA